jgi:hypothetical protein
MLKPCVGVVVVMSSSLSLRRMVVFPALSRPRIRMRACFGRGRGQAGTGGSVGLERKRVGARRSV